MQNNLDIAPQEPNESVFTPEETQTLRDLICKISRVQNQHGEGVDPQHYGISLIRQKKSSYRSYVSSPQTMSIDFGKLTVFFQAETGRHGSVEDHSLYLTSIGYEDEIITNFEENFSGPWWKHLRLYMAQIQAKIEEYDNAVSKARQNRLEQEKLQKERELIKEQRRQEKLREKYRQILDPKPARGSIMKDQMDPAQSKSKPTPFDRVMENAYPEYIEAMQNWWDQQKKNSKGSPKNN